MLRIGEDMVSVRVNQNLGMFLMFFWLGLQSTLMASNDRAVSPDSSSSRTPLLEELSLEDRLAMIDSLLLEGDDHFKAKDYRRAYESYENIFLLAPDHVTASRRIDRMKKQMVKENKSDIGLVRNIYKEEANIRVDRYWSSVNQFVAEGRVAQARFTLEKILLLDPFNEKAVALHSELSGESE